MKQASGLRGLVGAVCLLAFSLAAVPAGAQFDSGGGFGLGMGGANDDAMSLSAQFTASTADKPGQLFITARFKPEWYTYSLTQAPNGPTRTKIKLPPSSDYRLLGDFQAAPAPEKKQDKTYNMVVESHHGTAIWHAPIELAPGIDPKDLKITGAVFAQVCNASTCIPPRDYRFTASIGPGVDLAALAAQSPSPAAPRSAPPSESQASEGPRTVSPGSSIFNESELRQNVQQQLGQQSLAWILGAGFLGGFLLNLMPCVLPVIGLKLLSFIEQSGHDRRTSFLLNVWYSLGLLSVFWLLAGLAVVLRFGWGEQLQNSAFNVFMAAVVFTMALSFLGVWEFPVPGFVGRGSAAAMADQAGLAGAFSKGVITTLLATPCIGPFMGSALMWALNQPPITVFAVFTSVGLGMASPYLLIGTFPGLIRFLPKPGAWMDTFKHLMGFVLLGTIIYIFTFLETSYLVPTIALLFALWAACWWVARTPLTAELNDKVGAWLGAAAFVGVVWILLFPGIGSVIPNVLAECGWKGFPGLHQIMADRLDHKDDFWQPFTDRQSLGEKIAANRTVMVTFTADWCPNCKVLEAAVLNSQAVREAVEKYNVLPVKVDFTRQDPESGAMLEMLIGGRQIPVLAIFPAGEPNRPIVFVDGYTQRMVLDALAKAGPSKATR